MAHNYETGNIVFTSLITVTRFKKDSAAKTRSHVLLMSYFTWLPEEDALSVFHVSLLVKTNLENELMESNIWPSIMNHKIFYNLYPEKFHSVA